MNIFLLLACLLQSPVCTTNSRGERCPPDGVRHWMRGVLPDGTVVPFQGWHVGLRRYYRPGENEMLDRLYTSQILNYGVVMPPSPPGPSTTYTNDSQFGRWITQNRHPYYQPLPRP